MAFAYYQRLSPRQKAIYRRSDALTEVILGDPEALRPRVVRIGEALAADRRPDVERHARDLVRGLCAQLGAPGVEVLVLARRPADAMSELHGLYVRVEGERPTIRVWMRTAAHARPVALRTFVRTLLHEVCHHLDYDLHRLEDSFHTEGFFKRESSLARQLLPPPGRGTGRGTKTAARVRTASSAGPAPRAQLSLWDEEEEG